MDFFALAPDIKPATKPAEVQFVFEEKGWTGEMALSAINNTGNTSSTDVGAAGKFRYDDDAWRQFGSVVFDYGQSDSVETKNRFFADYELDRLIRDRLFGYGRGAVEFDEFDGYEARSVLGGGLGYQLVNTEARSWIVRGGPALRIDRLEPVRDPITDAIITPATTDTEAAASLGSNFANAFSEDVKLTNYTDVTASADTTTLFNSLALTSNINGFLALRASFDVTHETQPAVGAEETDTTSRVSLVYKIGE